MEEDRVKWTHFKKETIDFILQHYMCMNAKEIEQAINIPPKKINQILRQHGIKPLDGHCLLRLEDLEKFKQMYPSSTLEELSDEFPYIKTNSFHSMAAKLGVRKLNAPSVKRYTDDELLSMYKEVYLKIGRLPSDREHLEFNIPPAQTYRKHFGNLENICLLCNIPYSRHSTNIFEKYIGTNEYDSNSENLVKQAIELLDLPYVYNVFYSDYFGIKEFGKRRVDFILTDDDIVVEYFGLLGNKQYEEKMKYKINLCQKYNIKLVEMYPKDVNYRTLENIKQTLINKINQVS